MATVYTDGNGTYYQPGSVAPFDPNQQSVDRRTASGFDSLYMGCTDVANKIASVWSVAPNLTDIGAGVWNNGTLQNPQ